jgi:hypothetical protein
METPKLDAFLSRFNGIRALESDANDAMQELAALKAALSGPGTRAFEQRQCVAIMPSGSWCTNTARLGHRTCEEHAGNTP